MYQLTTTLLPKLGISQQNLHHYASLAHYYTIYDLRRLKPAQTYLYLLCYIWQRYQQLGDNLVDALSYHMKKLEDETKLSAEKTFAQSQASKQQEAPRVGRLLSLYVDEGIKDTTPFGAVQEQAYSIMPKDALLAASQLLSKTPVTEHEFRWQAIDKVAMRFKKQLRPLITSLTFSSTQADSPWLRALAWMKDLFVRRQTLSSRPVSECPKGTVPKRLRSFLLILDEDGTPTGINGDRYEFWIYRQIRKRFSVGELYLNDSLRHRSLADELVSLEEQADAIHALDIPWSRQPVNDTLDALLSELVQLWQDFDRDLRQGKLKHLEYDPAKRTITWRKPKVDKDEVVQAAFYGTLPSRPIADVFRLVNERCNFLSALTPLQPRYAKKIADEDSLMAAIFAQAMNYGNLRMAETSDIPYHVLDATHLQYLRLATLKSANDCISNYIDGLSIFPHYSLDLEVFYGSVDGQKFAAATPTTKARHSKKYFAGGKGVVAYTLLANHVSLQTEMIGANEHESHFVFDICYNNTSEIMPTVITGDMHSINKANFGILHCFGFNLYPRFTSLQMQLPHLYCGLKSADYDRFLIQPAGQIDR